MIETPQSFTTRVECDQATFQNGFRIQHGETAGWRCYGSTTARGVVWMGYGEELGWLLAVDHPSVVAELGVEPIAMSGPGRARFCFTSLEAVYAVLPRLYELSLKSHDGLMQRFLAQTQDKPRETEAERRVIQRIGQGVFRESLMAYWGGMLSTDGDHGRGITAGVAHQAVERVRNGRHAARCVQRAVAVGLVGRGV